MTHVILINGPRNVGKDTAARAMLRDGWATLPMFSERAKKIALAEAGGKPAAIDVYEMCKDTPMPDLGGLSPRQAYIRFGNAMRQSHPSYFINEWRTYADMAFGSSLQIPHADVLVVPDCRFFEEFIAVCDFVGGKNVYLMRIKRPEHDFVGDIGGYIRTDIAVFGNKETTIVNDQDEDFFKLEASVHARGFVARAEART